MAAPREKRTCPTVPDEQREIELALAELDERLRAWLGAVTHLGTRGLDAKRLTAAAEGSVAAASPGAGAADVRAAPEETDETLLGRLDPELANAVRVRRRLVGNRRTVRELIAEIEATRESKPKDTGRKTWWRRGDG